MARTIGDGVNSAFVMLAAEWTVAQARLVVEGTQSAEIDGIIVRRGGPPPMFYLYSRAKLLKQLDFFDEGVRLIDALNLHEYTASPVISTAQLPADLLERTVVLEPDGSVAGFINPAVIPKNIISGTMPFEAYPAVLAPEHVAANQSFDLAVGFRDKPDPALIGGAARMVVPDLQPAEECMVAVSGDGLVLDRAVGWLPFRMHESIMFNATPTRSGRCSVRVDYYRQRQLIGHAERIIMVDSTDQPEAPEGAPLEFSANDVDLLITLRRDGDQLLWTVMPNDPEFAPLFNLASPQPLSAAAAQQYAQEVIREAVQGNPQLAASGIEAVASELTVWVPTPVWDLQAAIAQKLQRPLTVLLKTDEVFVPWELAYLPAALADPNPPAAPKPLFWAAQTYFARWIDHVQALPMPPNVAAIKHLTAVASAYGKGTGQSELKHALPEQDLLVKGWQATPCEATSAGLAALMTTPHREGHLIHFAVHGRSEPLANTQSLILADQNPLSPRTLMGRRGQKPPRFSLVFLNACQVATPGTSLGQTAGFPGEVVSSGALGFIAPLWEADDNEAFSFAQTFYTQAFASQSIGEILHSYRCSYTSSDSTTRLAYVYYGHPALRLQHQPEGV